jgi:hypothetical protein
VHSNVLGSFGLPDPFPPRTVVNHTYAENTQLTTGASGSICGAHALFHINDMYAPGGQQAHQPYGFDQMTPLYKRFKVHRVVIDLQACSNAPVTTTTQPAQLLVGVCGGDSSTVLDPTGLSDISVVEQANCIYALQLGNYEGSRRETREIEMYRLFGVTKAEYDADVSLFTGTGSSSPTRLCYFALAASGLVGANTNVHYTIKFTFVVEWFERITVSAS